VFDGHGGWQVSDYASRNLHLYLDEKLKECKSDREVMEAIVHAFDMIENDWLKAAELVFEKGFPKVASVGSCALIAVIHNNKLFVANAGDCKAGNI